MVVRAAQGTGGAGWWPGSGRRVPSPTASAPRPGELEEVTAKKKVCCRAGVRGWTSVRRCPLDPPLRAQENGSRPPGRGSRRDLRLVPRADREQVLLLEARLLGGAAVPLVAEPPERLVELGRRGRCAPRWRARRSSARSSALKCSPYSRARSKAVISSSSRSSVWKSTRPPNSSWTCSSLPHSGGGWRAGRRRRGERLHRREQRAEHALGRPAQQPDRAAGAADAHELVRGGLVMGREHHADRGHDDVERLVLERQVLGVGLDPVELEALGLGAAAARLEQLAASGRWRSRSRRSAPPGSTRCRCRRRRRARACPGPMPQASTSRGPSGSRNVSTIKG